MMLLLVAALTACENENLPAAAGDHAVLEQLAQAYRKVGEHYPMQPQAMLPEGRRKFVDQVFRQAGYSYSASLISMASRSADNTDQDQRDLVELLLLPAKGLSDKSLDKSYSTEEQAAVQRLRTTFR
jgi:hypothetical protein